MTDDTLMQAAQAGDGEAYAELFARYEHRIEGYLMKHLGKREVAEDLSQEVWMRVWEKRAKYQAGTTFRPWLFTVARNCLIDFTRKRSADILRDALRDPPGEDPILANYPAAAEDAAGAELREFDRNVTEALESIPDKQRATIELYYRDGYSLAQIADAAGVPVPTAKSWLRLGLEKIAVAL